MANQPDLSGEPPTTGGSASFNAKDTSNSAGSLRTRTHDGPQPSLTSPSIGAGTVPVTVCSLLDGVARLLPAKNRRLPVSNWEVVALAEDEELGIIPELPLLKDELILDSVTECIQQTDYFETYFDLYEASSIVISAPLGQSTLGAVWQWLCIGVAGAVGLSDADQGFSTTLTVRYNILRITTKCVCQLNKDDSPYALLTLTPGESVLEPEGQSPIATRDLTFEWKRLSKVNAGVPPES